MGRLPVSSKPEAERRNYWPVVLISDVAALRPLSMARGAHLSGGNR